MAHINYELIQKLSFQEPKSLLERAVKLQEELGELAQEVLIAQKASGSQHKIEGPDGILGECIDIMLVALSIYFSQGGQEKDLEERLLKKCLKWESLQVKT